MTSNGCRQELYSFLGWYYFLLINLKQGFFVPRIFSSHLLKTCFAWGFFQRVRHGLLVMAAICLVSGAFAAEDIVTRPIIGSDFQSASEALIEAIEAEGLVVSAKIPFNAMLERTAGAVSRQASPFANVQIVQFCSSLLAWQLLEEEAAQIALCPLSMTLYEMGGDRAKGEIYLAYRSPGQATAGRMKAEKLLQRLVDRSAELARWRW